MIKAIFGFILVQILGVGMIGGALWLRQEAPKTMDRAKEIATAPVARSERDLRPLADGRMVALRGRITGSAANTPLIFDVERCDRERRKKRTRYEWDRSQTKRPSFSLRLSDGTVSAVSTGSYEAEGFIHTSGESSCNSSTVGKTRTRSFWAGDEVSAIGYVRGNSVQLIAVSSRTPENYADYVQNQGVMQSYGAIGLFLAGMGTSLISVARKIFPFLMR